MAIFKKSAIQGNFILSNGTPIVFVANHYETEDENIIAQISPIYEQVESAPDAPAAKKQEAPAAPALKGMASSATLVTASK